MKGKDSKGRREKSVRRGSGLARVVTETQTGIHGVEEVSVLPGSRWIIEHSGQEVPGGISKTDELGNNGGRHLSLSLSLSLLL